MTPPTQGKSGQQTKEIDFNVNMFNRKNSADTSVSPGTLPGQQSPVNATEHDSDNSGSSDGSTSVQTTMPIPNFAEKLEEHQAALLGMKTVTREDIRDEQKKEAERFKAALDDTLKKYLPVHVFAYHPDLARQKEKTNDDVPTILEQDVARAQANAQLNVYLNYISLKNKAAFITEFKDLRDQNTKNSQELMCKFRDQTWASAKPEYHETKKQRNSITGEEEPRRKHSVHALKPIHEDDHEAGFWKDKAKELQKQLLEQADRKVAEAQEHKKNVRNASQKFDRLVMDN